MEGCPGCFDGAKGKQERLTGIKDKARDYAKEQKKSVVIVQEADGPKYYTAEYAAGRGFIVIDYIPYSGCTGEAVHLDS